MLKLFTFCALLFLSLHANTPFNLEGIEELKVNIVDENTLISPAQKQQIIAELQTKLHHAGITTKAHGISTMYIKIEEESSVVSIVMFVGEEVRVKRSGATVHTFAFTYFFNDLFVPESLFEEVKDSIVSYLLGLFIEQYKEDNEEF